MVTASTDVEVHVSWCDGTHDTHGGCVHVVEWRDSTGSRNEGVVVAVPCDNAYVQFDGLGLYAPTDVDRLVEALTTLRPLLEAARLEADCFGHTYTD